MCRKKTKTQKMKNLEAFKKEQENIATRLKRLLNVPVIDISYIEKTKGVYNPESGRYEMNREHRQVIPNSKIILGGFGGKGTRILVVFSFCKKSLDSSQISKINKEIKPYYKVNYESGETQIIISNNPAVSRLL